MLLKLLSSLTSFIDDLPIEKNDCSINYFNSNCSYIKRYEDNFVDIIFSTDSKAKLIVLKSTLSRMGMNIVLFIGDDGIIYRQNKEIILLFVYLIHIGKLDKSLLDDSLYSNFIESEFNRLDIIFRNKSFLIERR